MKQFEVTGFTTSFDEWIKIHVNKDIKYNSMDHNCLRFAMRQHGFMTALKATIGTEEYKVGSEEKTITTDTLDDVVIDGPLYSVYYLDVDDMSAEKTVYKQYVNPHTFETKEGMWYPTKRFYRVRCGFLDL